MSPWLVVLAGGSGTRFWPRSKAGLPKQLLNIAGDEPLLCTTIRRFQSWVPADHIFVVTTESLEAATKSALQKFPAVNILAEPESRNTAPCIAMAMEWIRAKDANASVVIVPADHWITDTSEYIKVMQSALKTAQEKHCLVTVGIQPTRPETGYGYIRCGEEFGNGSYRVDRFVEKPKKEVAETMVQSSEYLWNAGMFVWELNTYFKEMEKSSPEFVQAFVQYRAALSAGKSGKEELKKDYGKATATSIDYALLEKTKNIAVVPGSSFGWNDLGSFISLEEIYPKVEGGVARASRVMAVDSFANIIDCPGKTVALLGVTDMILVEAGGIILLAAKEKAQDVKKIVERLKQEGAKDLI